MSRAQAIVVRGDRVLLVQHHEADGTYWCLPGGAIEPGESPAAAALRELREECGVRGRIVAETAVTTFAPGDQHVTFLVEIDDQEPMLGHDPEFDPDRQILTAVAWRRLEDVRPLDRVYLWSAGLLTVPGFLDAARLLTK